jgi:hypothetical protein
LSCSGEGKITMSSGKHGVVESGDAVAGVDVAIALGLAAVTAIWLVAYAVAFAWSLLT